MPRPVTVVIALLLAVAPSTVRVQPTPDVALLERGRYLVEVAAFCGACHAARGPGGLPIPGGELAGGRVMQLRGIRAVVPNITPDPETGIGRWTDAEVAASIRDGRRPDGSLIGPPMPTDLYRGISDRDLAAMVAYLRATPPVRNRVEGRSSFPFPLVPHGPPVASVPDPPQDDPVARGAYLAGPLAHCTECHSPPLAGERRDWSRTGAAGVVFDTPSGPVVAPNISAHPDLGLGRWTDEQVIAALTRGTSADGRRLAPPMSARAPVWSRLTERDLRDIVAYLRSIPPREP